eukprot:847389-Pelagomonas_calceolata.AAC.3
MSARPFLCARLLLQVDEKDDIWTPETLLVQLASELNSEMEKAEGRKEAALILVILIYGLPTTKAKGYIAVPAYVGSLAEAKKVPVTEPVLPTRPWAYPAVLIERMPDQVMEVVRPLALGTAQLYNFTSYNLQWGLAFSQVVWLLGLLNCSNCTKHIHEIENKTIRKGKGYIAVPANKGSLAGA